jgi:integrase
MNISFQLSRPQNPQSSVVAQFIYDGKKRRLGMGLSVPSDRWNKGKQRIKVLASIHHNERMDYEVLNKRLDTQENLIHLIVHELTIDLGKAPTWLEFKEGWKRKIQGKQRASMKHLTFNQWVKEFIEDAPNRLNGKGKKISHRTIQKYNTVYTQLCQYSIKHIGHQISFEDWNRELLDGYKRFRAKQGVSINTIAKDVKVIKMWLKESYTTNLHDNRAHMETYFSPKQVKTLKVHLTLQDLTLLEAVKLPSKGKHGQTITALETVRDLFLLACWTGVRISDLKRFPELIKDAWDDNGGSCPSSLSFIQSKTNSPVKVPLLDAAQRIINKHNGSLPKAINEQKMNSTIKQVVKLAGITRMVETPSTSMTTSKAIRKPLNELVTLHTARRTFATNMHSLEVLSVNELMSLTGHESESALKTYLNIDRLETSSKASEKIREALKQRAA